MENQIEKILGILTKTESDLRELIVEAAQAGDYRSVDTARAAAVNIHDLLTRIANPSSKLESKFASKASGRKKKSASRKGIKSKYPKFDVRNGTLIRIGWSKKQRREYTHKVPRFAFNQTVKGMVALAQSGAGPFMAEQIIEQVNSMEAETIPSYRVYVVLGLLRQTNCIKQVGREGYDIPVELVEKAENGWAKLSNKKI